MLYRKVRRRASFRRSSKPNSSAPGATMVEVAIAIPLFLVVLLGVIDICRYSYIRLLADYATFEAADYAAKLDVYTKTKSSECAADPQRCDDYETRVQLIIARCAKIAALVASPSGTGSKAQLESFVHYDTEKYTDVGYFDGSANRIGPITGDCAFLRPGEVVIAQSDQTNLPHPVRRFPANVGEANQAGIGWPLASWGPVFASGIPLYVQARIRFEPIFPFLGSHIITSDSFSYPQFPQYGTGSPPVEWTSTNTTVPSPTVTDTPDDPCWDCYQYCDTCEECDDFRNVVIERAGEGGSAGAAGPFLPIFPFPTSAGNPVPAQCETCCDNNCQIIPPCGDTPTPSRTPTISTTRTITSTRSATRTITLTPTKTKTGTNTATGTITPTRTKTGSVTVTATRTPTVTNTPQCTKCWEPGYSPPSSQGFNSSTLPNYPGCNYCRINCGKSCTGMSTCPARCWIDYSASLWYCDSIGCGPSPTPTITRTRTNTRTITLTPTVTLTPTITQTFTKSFTRTPTRTPTTTCYYCESVWSGTSCECGDVPCDPNYVWYCGQCPGSQCWNDCLNAPNNPSPGNPCPTKTPTPTITKTATNTRTFTRTPTGSPTNTRTVTNSGTPTSTSTRTLTFTITLTRTPSSTSTLSATPTITLTPTQSRTSTNTHTRTPSFTTTPSFTPSRTNTLTSTLTSTLTPSHTATATRTPTFTSVCVSQGCEDASGTCQATGVAGCCPCYALNCCKNIPAGCESILESNCPLVVPSPLPTP